MPHDLVDTFTIEGAGHAANLERPDMFNAAVVAFAERIAYVLPGGGRGEPPASPADANHGETARGTALPIVDGASDDELGPSLYAELGSRLRGRGRQMALRAGGFGLMAVGAGLLVAAYFVGGDSNGNGNVAAGADEATATPAPMERAAGVRTAAPNTPTPSAVSTVAAARPTITPTPATAAAVVGTPVAPRPGEDDEPPEPTQAVDTPTPEPTSTLTPTPAGPWVQINGPSAAEVGEAVTFGSAESAGALRRDWSASNGARAAHTTWFTVTFDTPGCQSVTVTALFPEGARASTQVVAVGGASCGLG
jgi:hypothetical protein